MDDVLPKPFTRQSLLEMLEKHLVHLKSMDAPPSATGISMTAHSSAPHSVKEENSPGQSPATSMNNWQSPSQIPGVSPMHPNMGQVPSQYVQQTTPTAPSFAMDQNGVQYPTAAPLGSTPIRPPHRRQVSEMSGVTENAHFAKRPRMYPQHSQPVVGQLQGGRNG